MTHIIRNPSQRRSAPSRSRRARRIGFGAAPFVLALVLVGCTTGGTSTGMPGMDHGGGTSDIILAKSGIAPPVLDLALAQAIIESQTAEIATMRELLTEI
jgi:hypothetical protein